MADAIEQLRRRYLCLQPANIHSLQLPEGRLLADNQDALCSFLLNENGLDAGQRWRAHFIKAVIGRIESILSTDEEVDGRLYEAVIQAMSVSTTDATVDRSYVWGPLSTHGQSIRLREAYAHVSEGTTGLRVWPAAIHLANHLLANPGLIANKKVLEIGCGIGLISILAAKLGASKVLATDLDQVLQQTEINIDRNGCSDRIETRVLDWNSEDTDTDKFDVILGSDIVYDAAVVDAQCRLLRGHLQNAAATILICVCVRNETTWDAFKDAAERHNLAIVNQEVKVPSSGEGLINPDEAASSSVLLVKIERILQSRQPI